MTSSPHAITRAVRRLAAVSLATLALASDAPAQRHLAPAGAHTVVAPLDVAGSRAAANVADRGDRVFDHTVGGALIGLLAGAAYALVLTGNSSDDSEDGFAFVLLMPLGAVVGAVAGTAVGLARTQ